jgi:hypothetical protein
MSMIARVIWMSACDGVGSPDGWLCTTLLFLSNVLKVNEFGEVIDLRGDGDWGRLCVLLRDHHASSPSSSLGLFEARHETVFF